MSGRTLESSKSICIYTFFRFSTIARVLLFIRAIDQRTFFSLSYLIECKFSTFFFLKQSERVRERRHGKRKLNFLSLRFSLSLASWNELFFPSIITYHRRSASNAMDSIYKKTTNRDGVSVSFYIYALIMTIQMKKICR